MFITSVLSVEGPGLEGVAGAVEVLGVVVEETGGGVVEEGEPKWTVIRAGPVWFVVRFTVMGIAGLWNLRRGRHVRQNLLGVRFDVSM
jgi:hypothetical protein